MRMKKLHSLLYNHISSWSLASVCSLPSPRKLPDAPHNLSPTLCISPPQSLPAPRVCTHYCLPICIVLLPLTPVQCSGNTCTIQQKQRWLPVTASHVSWVRTSAPWLYMWLWQFLQRLLRNTKYCLKPVVECSERQPLLLWLCCYYWHHCWLVSWVSRLRQRSVCRKFIGYCSWDQYLLGSERSKIGQRRISQGSWGVRYQ